MRSLIKLGGQGGWRKYPHLTLACTGSMSPLAEYTRGTRVMWMKVDAKALYEEWTKEVKTHRPAKEA